MTAKAKCIKCDGEMTAGFVVDRTNGEKLQQVWIAGQPEASQWVGLKTGNRDNFNVQAFRCANCNYLEFYTADRVYI
jgi:predicted nucleic-acid-binding Zn-ribbon protein